MEGRAIARPNLEASRSSFHSTMTFNGGPGNCPAKLVSLLRECLAVLDPSMEGRAIARPNLRR